MSHLLGLDLGTTNFKAAVYDREGRRLASARCPTPIEEPHPGWVEIPLDRFRETIVELIGRLREQDANAVERVGALSFASQTNSFVLLDGEDRPLTPLILWCDRRAEGGSAWVERLKALPGLYRRTGVPALRGHFAVAKLEWLSRHEPQAWRRARRFLLISDYLTMWFTGKAWTEAGAAALTGLLDIHELAWWPEARAVLEHEALALPEPVRAGTPAGTIRAEVAETLGLRRDCRFAVGCLDQYAGAIGVGTDRPGAVCETTGTVLAVVACAETFDPSLAERGVFQGPGDRARRYYRMAFSGLAANLLEAYRREHAPEHSFAELDRLAAPLVDQPLACELDVAASEAEGQAIFRHSPHSPGEGALAIMRAVAGRLNEQLVSVCGESKPAEVTCAGGAARSELWRQLKERATGVAMRVTETDEPTCRGAALCAAKSLDPNGS